MHYCTVIISSSQVNLIKDVYQNIYQILQANLALCRAINAMLDRFRHYIASPLRRIIKHINLINTHDRPIFIIYYNHL